MMHAVIRTATDSIHLIGHVDPYNVESLRDHVRGMTHRGDVSVVITIDPADEPAFDLHAGRWLSRLVRAGIQVLVRSGTHAAPLPSRNRVARISA